jgi:hypothetical protein
MKREEFHERRQSASRGVNGWIKPSIMAMSPGVYRQFADSVRERPDGLRLRLSPRPFPSPRLLLGA